MKGFGFNLLLGPFLIALHWVLTDVKVQFHKTRGLGL